VPTNSDERMMHSTGEYRPVASAKLAINYKLSSSKYIQPKHQQSFMTTFSTTEHNRKQHAFAPPSLIM